MMDVRLDPESQPRLSVTRGEISDEELVALTAAVMATNSYAPAPKTAPGPRSQTRALLRRAILALPAIPGPGSWKWKR